MENKEFYIEAMKKHLETEAMPKITKNQDFFRSIANKYFESIANNGIECQAFLCSDARGIILTIGKYANLLQSK